MILFIFVTLLLRPVVDYWGSVEVFSAFGMDLTLQYTIGALSVILMMVYIAIKRITANASWYWFAWLFILILSISAIRESTSIQILGDLLRVVYWILLLIVTQNVFRNNEFNRLKGLQRVAITSLLFPIILGSYYLLSGQFMDVRGALVLAPYEQVHQMPILLCFLAPMMFLTPDSGTKTIRLVLLATAGVLILLSGVRTAIVAFLIFISFRFVIFSKRDRILNSVYIIVVLALLMVVYDRFQLDANPRLRFYSLSERGLDYFSSGRSFFWSEALQYWAEGEWHEIVFGRGLRSFQKVSGSGIWTHNDYLDVLVNTGIVGLIAYLAFLNRLFVHLWRSVITIDKAALRSYVIVFIFVSFFDGIIYKLSTITYAAMFFGICLGTASDQNTLAHSRTLVSLGKVKESTEG